MCKVMSMCYWYHVVSCNLVSRSQTLSSFHARLWLCKTRLQHSYNLVAFQGCVACLVNCWRPCCFSLPHLYKKLCEISSKPLNLLLIESGYGWLWFDVTTGSYNLKLMIWAPERHLDLLVCLRETFARCWQDGGGPKRISNHPLTRSRWWWFFRMTAWILCERLFPT